MNKKTIISLLLALLVLAVITYFFFNKKTSTVEDTTVKGNNVENAAAKVENKDENTVEAVTLKLGEYGDLKNVIKTDLSDIDKKALQVILNKRELVRAKYQTLINIAKNNPSSDAGMLNGAIENYKVAMAKFDASLKTYMTTKSFAEYKNTVKETVIKSVVEKAYAK
jgi:hypothetical protein